MDAPDTMACGLMQKVLHVLRPAQKNSCGVTEKLQILVHEWQEHANLKPAPLSSKQKAVRKELRRNPDVEEALQLYANASVDERAKMRPTIARLSSAAGRADIMNSDGARHESAPSAEAFQTDAETTPSQTICIPPPGTSVIFHDLSHFECSHLNGSTAVILGYDACVNRYEVECENGAKVRVARGNIHLEVATACELIAEFTAIRAHEDVMLLNEVHGEHATGALVEALLSIPNRAWTVADDLWLIAEFWRVRSGTHGSRRLRML
jgi:hypothetical protein|mmetsp:Transcript_49986/g.131781  ORF Transcript_49986/g.131781 Transcript_49986/m.131781 type:complete len:266 (+) Transcript_49986:113-910(+)